MRKEVTVERRKYNIPQSEYDQLKYKNAIYLIENHRPSKAQIEKKVYHV